MNLLKVNPFVSRLNISPHDRLKLILGLVILMPFRSILVIALTVLSSVVGYLLILVTTLTGYRNITYAQSTFKRICLKANNLIYVLSMFVAGLRVEVEDRREDSDKRRKSGIVVVAPHSSYFDFPSIMAIDVMTPVAKKDALSNPLVGNQLILSNAILVDRNDELARQQVIKDIADRSRNELVGLFPEGTTTNASSLIRFKTGAFIPGMPVSPVMIQYTNKSTVDHVTWTWQGANVVKLLVLSCASWSWTRSKVTILPTYHPNDEEKKCPQLYADNVRKYMAANLNIPVTRYSFEDAFFLDFATKATISYSAISLKLIKQTYKLSKFQRGSNEGASVQLASIDDNLNFDLKHRSRVNISDNEKNSHEYEKLIKLTHQQIFERLVKNTTKKLIRLMDVDPLFLSSEISTLNDFVQVLVMPVNVDTIYIKHALIDLMDRMKLNTGSVVTYEHLLLFLTLMDSAIDIWKRIEHFELLATKLTAVNDQEALKYLTWYLIGVEEHQLNASFLNSYELNCKYLKCNLEQTFRTAFTQNCAHLSVD